MTYPRVDTLVRNRSLEVGARDLADLAKFLEIGPRGGKRLAFCTSGLAWKSVLRRLFNLFAFVQLFEALARVLGPANTNADVEQVSAARSSRRRVQGGGCMVMREKKPNSVWSTIFLAFGMRKAAPPCFLAVLIFVAALLDDFRDVRYRPRISEISGGRQVSGHRGTHGAIVEAPHMGSYVD